MKRNLKYFCILGFLISACASPATIPTESAGIQNEPVILPTPIWTNEPTAIMIPPTPIPEYINQICSPLDGDSISELAEIITQPFKAPRPGHDDGHHGVDFAYFRRKDRLSIDGVAVLAAMEGTVVTVLNDRWPYGNAVIIETPLKAIDPEMPFILDFPEREPTVMPDPKMGHCQSGELSFLLNDQEESLYIFYGHLKYPTNLKVGDYVGCGQPIGEVGNTGDSSNPHLHLETRIGPSGARFESMAYYIVDATASERYNYCVWRVTNLFQVFDAMILFSSSD